MQIAVGIAIQLVLGVIVFTIAYRRNRRYYNRTPLGAVGIALPAALFCPIGALVVYGLTLGQEPGRRN